MLAVAFLTGSDKQKVITVFAAVTLFVRCVFIFVKIKDFVITD